MSIFFKKAYEKRNRKSFTILKLILTVLMVVMLVMSILNGNDIFYIKLVFLFVGIALFSEAMESYIQRQSQKTIWREIGIGVLFIVLAIFLK